MALGPDVWSDPCLAHEDDVPAPRADSDWFDGFVDASAVTLRRALVARNGVEDGCEAAAEALAWAWEHRDELEEMTNPLGYLFRVGQSSLRRERRHRRRRSEFDVEPHVEDRTRFDADLFAGLARLTPDQRTAVVMVHMYGFSYRDVASLLDVSDAAVTNHVHRGLARLRRILEEHRP